MRMLAALLAFGFVPVTAQTALQPPGTWKTFTAMEFVRSGVVSGSVIWAAGSGGLFAADQTAQTIRSYTASDGLSGNDLSAVLLYNGSLWVGAVDGAIDILDPGGSWSAILDIRDSQRIQKRIRTLKAEGDTVFIGSDFGISVYRNLRSEFGDTYANFGFTSQPGVNKVVVKNGEIWAATDQGVARAARFGLNLSSPTSWTRFQTAQGLPSNTVTAMIVVQDTLIVGTSSGAAYFDGSTFQPIASLAGRAIVDALQAGNQWYVLWNQTGTHTVQLVPGVAGTALTVAANTGGTANGLIAQQAGVPQIATSFAGVTQWNGGSWDSWMPNGPNSSLFSSLIMDGNGVLWCGSGISGQGRGFYRYDPSRPDGQQWKNFTVAAFPIMETNDFYKVGVGTGGSAWVSSWGRGVIEIANDTIRRKLDADSSPALASSVPSGPAYEVIGSVAADAAGQTWFVNRTAVNSNFLARLVNDTTLAYSTNVIHPGQGTFTVMAIDENGTKWLGNAEPFNKPATGLYYFNSAGIVSGTSGTGGWGHMNTADGLPDNTVLSLAIDKTGSVIVGTDIGLMIISEPLFPKQRHFSSFPLREQSVQAVVVDAVNNKWVGTKEGVFLMNADATQILRQYTVAGTGGRLVDNDVRSIAIDHERGIAYFGTERGMSSLSIAPVRTEQAFSTIDVGPNPFLIPSETPLMIRNLIEESSVKILRVDGSLVVEFTAQGGGRAFWDGKDSAGQTVGSGIYFVVAYARDGEEIGTGKVAVVRK
jgi:ligand-binding sensor domain-containing protein